MTAIEALQKLQDLPHGDTELVHWNADRILLEFLEGHDPACKDVAEAYNAAKEKEGGFWYA